MATDTMDKEFEIKPIGVLHNPEKDITVYSIGKPDPTNYDIFDELKGAKVLAAEGNMLMVKKVGQIYRYFLGESDDALFLSKFQTNTQVSGCNTMNNCESEENPLSHLVGDTIDDIKKSYLPYSPDTKEKDLPFEVKLEAGQTVYDLQTNEGEIIIYLKELYPEGCE